MTDPHVEGSLTLTEGYIAALRVDRHPAGECSEILRCAVCQVRCWVTARACRFVAVKPWIPVLCCSCAEQSAFFIEQTLSGSYELARQEVPDLSELYSTN